VNQAGDTVVNQNDPDEDKNNDDVKVLTGWQRGFSLHPRSGHKIGLPRAAALHIQCNYSQTHHNKYQKNDKKPFHSFYRACALPPAWIISQRLILANVNCFFR